MARRPLETTRLIQGRSPYILIQGKFVEPSEALPNLKVKKKLNIFLLKLNRVSELITFLIREFQTFGPWKRMVNNFTLALNISSNQHHRNHYHLLHYH